MWSSKDLLPFDEPRDRCLRCAQTIGSLRRVHEAAGQVICFGCREAADLRHLRPAFPWRPEPVSDIPCCAGNASRGIRRMSSLMRWHTILPPGIWCPRAATRPGSVIRSSEQAGKHLMGGACARPRGASGHARSPLGYDLSAACLSDAVVYRVMMLLRLQSSPSASRQ